MDWYYHPSDEDYSMMLGIMGGCRHPDISIMPDGKPYLYRWHLVRRPEASVYLHLQVGNDPRDELHDHPWDNTSVILSGGYTEILSIAPTHRPRIGPSKFIRSKGNVIFRRAAWAHRLLMAGHPYTVTLFSTGPHIRDWGYWFPDGWHHNERHNVLVDGVATFKEEM